MWWVQSLIPFSPSPSSQTQTIFFKIITRIKINNIKIKSLLSLESSNGFNPGSAESGPNNIPLTENLVTKLFLMECIPSILYSVQSTEVGKPQNPLYHSGGEECYPCIMAWVRTPSTANLTSKPTKSIVWRNKKKKLQNPRTPHSLMKKPSQHDNTQMK